MAINVLTFRFLCVFVSIAFFKTGIKAEDSKAEKVWDVLNEKIELWNSKKGTFLLFWSAWTWAEWMVFKDKLNFRT